MTVGILGIEVQKPIGAASAARFALDFPAMAVPYIPSEKSEQVWTRGRVRYPWIDWFDGHLWKLTAGEDFQVSPRSFAAQAHHVANVWGFKVRTRVEGDVVWLQSNQQLQPIESEDG